MDIFEAITRNNIPAVSLWLKSDEHDLNERNDKGVVGLHICATLDLVEMTRLLLDYGADTSLKDYESGYTPLHRALYHRHHRVAWLLIRSGAILDVGIDEFCKGLVLKPHQTSLSNARIPDCRDKEGLTPLGLLSTTLKSTLYKASNYQTDIFAFGKADYQLGVTLPNSSSDVVRPKRIHTLAGESVMQITANKHHSLALTASGCLYSWGHGRNGRLGHGSDHLQLEPKRIIGLKEKIIYVSAGLNHTLALSDEGDIYSWGSDRYGQLGQGQHHSDTGVVVYPTIIESIRKERVTGISAGEYHSICCSSTGDVYCWGSNKVGQLGFKISDVQTSASGCPMLTYPKRVTIKSSTSSSKVQSKHHIIQVKAAYSSSLILIKPSSSSTSSGSVCDNEVYLWGNGCCAPMKVKFPMTNTLAMYPDAKSYECFMICDKTVNIIHIAAGMFHSVAVSDIGHVYTWGLGSDQLGHPTTHTSSHHTSSHHTSSSHDISNDTSSSYDTPSSSHYTSPRLVEALLPERGGGKIIYVDASVNRTCAISDQGDLYTWGATNQQGVLGHSSYTSYQPIPKRVAGVKRASCVALGEDHTLILTVCCLPALPIDGFYRHHVDDIIQHHHTKEHDDDNDDDDDVMYDKIYYDEDDIMYDGKIMIQVPSLKQFCERRLAQMADAKYIPIIDAIADTFAASDLKHFCRQYINMNLDAIITQAKAQDLDIWIKDHHYHDKINSSSSYDHDHRDHEDMIITPIRNHHHHMVASSLSSSYKINIHDHKDDDHHHMMHRSKDQDTSMSVARLIKAAKKKLHSINDILHINHSELLKEQLEKVNKKESLQAELHRLQMIYNRLRGEEDIIDKAKQCRIATSTSMKSNDMISSDDKHDKISSSAKTSTSDMISSSAKTASSYDAVDDKNSISSSNGDSSSSCTDRHHDSMTMMKGGHKGKKTWKIPSDVHQATPIIDQLKAAQQQPLSSSLASSSSISSSPSSSSSKKKLPLSAIGPQGQTVLSPPTSIHVPAIDPAMRNMLISTSSSATTSTAYQSSSFMTPSSAQVKAITKPQKELSSLPFDAMSSSTSASNLTLASFIKTPKKKSPAATMTPEKAPVVSSSAAKPFTWPSSSSTTPKPPATASPMSLWQDIPSSTSSISSMASASASHMSLRDIQRIEEDIKQHSSSQSNIYTSGNGSASGSAATTNPWYVERRMRAPSIDAVIKIQEAQRLEIERQRRDDIELQDALRQIAEAEAREKLSSSSSHKNKMSNKSKQGHHHRKEGAEKKKAVI